jgi:hypothetical protein
MFVTVVKAHERGIKLVASAEDERRVRLQIDVLIRRQRRAIRKMRP